MSVVNVNAVRTKALIAVTKPDVAASMRRIFRWYSREFSTPLHTVDTLPLEDILQAYYEDRYESMEEPLLEQEMAEMSLTPAERAKVEAAQTEADEEFEAMVLAQIKQAEDQAKSGKPDRLPEDVSVKFGDANLLEDLGTFDPMAPPPKAK